MVLRIRPIPTRWTANHCILYYMCGAHAFAVDGGIPYKLYRSGYVPVSGIHQKGTKTQPHQ